MRNVIKRERVRVGGGPIVAGEATEEAGVRQERGVRVVHLDDGTVAVEYTWKCGDVALFEIEFEPPSKEA